MLKLRAMVEWVAGTTGIPVPTVNETARQLQKAGLIKTGRPGRYGGSSMDEADAAALVIALLAAEGRRGVVDAAQAVRDLGHRRLWVHSDPGDLEEVPQICEMFDLPLDHTFADLVRAAVRTAPDPEQTMGFEITMSFPQSEAQVLLGEPVKRVIGEYGAREQVIFRSQQVARTPAFSVRRSFSDVFFWGLHREIFSKADPEVIADDSEGGDDE